MKTLCEACSGQLCAGIMYGFVRVEFSQTRQDAVETFLLVAASGIASTPAESS